MRQPGYSAAVVDRSLSSFAVGPVAQARTQDQTRVIERGDDSLML